MIKLLAIFAFTVLFLGCNNPARPQTAPYVPPPPREVVSLDDDRFTGEWRGFLTGWTHSHRFRFYNTNRFYMSVAPGNQSAHVPNFIPHEIEIATQLTNLTLYRMRMRPWSDYDLEWGNWYNLQLVNLPSSFMITGFIYTPPHTQRAHLPLDRHNPYLPATARAVFPR